MAEDEAVIRVYAQLHSNLEDTNWSWIHCLTFPIQKLNSLQFTSKLYKWLRYATGVVVGAQGSLSTQRDSNSPVDYEAGALPDLTIDLYYYVSDKERVHMCPMDPEFAKSKLTSSEATSRRADFRETVGNRDGNQCVLTNGGEVLCDAVHLVAHGKGDLV